MFALWSARHFAIQTDSRAPGILPGMFRQPRLAHIGVINVNSQRPIFPGKAAKLASECPQALYTDAPEGILCLSLPTRRVLFPIDYPLDHSSCGYVCGGLRHDEHGDQR